MKNPCARINQLWLRALPLLLSAFSAFNPPSAVGDEPKDPVAEMDHLIAADFRSNSPGATVLLVHGGAVKLRKAYGLADLELGVPMDPANVLPICSITKQFTAVAILQLVEAGKLKLTDDLATWVPDYPTGGAKVTLAQLMSNMSGIPNFTDDPRWQKSLGQDLTPEQTLDFTRNKPLEFAPGSNWKYSNTGFTLLGLVIEKASGQNYSDYVRTHIFEPAAMAHSYYADSSRIIPRRVHGYSLAAKTWVNAPYFSLVQAYSGGALLSTVDDMWAWEQALQAGRLVNTNLLQSAYTERQLPDGRGTHYGFGWEVNKMGGHNMIEHAGGIRGFSGYEASVPDAGLYVVILANTDELTVPLRNVVHNLLKIELGETASSVAPAPLTPSEMEEYAGTYQIGGGATFPVFVKNNRLYGQLGQGQRPLKLIAPDEFTTRDEEFHFRFVRDAAHHIQKIVAQPNAAGPELIWPRVENLPKPSP
jgi:CubicO group peptidase (beta-lactamase class C family)